jgi:hypothetical protein
MHNTPVDIQCHVLRQATYRPGEWLLSDRHDTGILFLHQSPSVLAAMANVIDMPWFVLAQETRPGLITADHAWPIAHGEYQFGGNWLWSDDARFPSPHPIPIHDAARQDADHGH